MSGRTQYKEDYDSDKEFQRPKDEFIFYYKAFKIEEKKMITHVKFEEITTKYWQLLRKMYSQDINKPTISQQQYIDLLKRMYKVLLPLYREDEIVSELSQEWLMDNKGRDEMTQLTFTKVLFRIAHWWATNIDLDEYIDLLEKIFNRITVKYIYSKNQNQLYEQSRIIYITFPIDEKKYQEAGGKIDKGDLLDDWLECRSDESNKSEYDYKYEEDPDQMIVKKFKKMKREFNGFGNSDAQNQVNLTVKEPFIYQEEVVYEYDKSLYPLETEDLLNIDQILPFGFYAEQFLCQLKNEVYTTIQDARAEEKQKFQNMSKEEREAERKFQKEDLDTGIVEETGSQMSYYVSSPYLVSSTYAKITDSLYNSYRRLMRDGVNMTLTMYTQHPKPGVRSKSRATSNAQDPIFELNKFGYNPALERRVSYKLGTNFSINCQQFMNINYMVQHPNLETVYRCDIQKIETKGKLALKENEEIKRDEEFVNVETSYKKLRQIMLNKKFENIYNERSNADNKEMKRLAKLLDKEEKRKHHAMKPVVLAQKGLTETHEEKTFIKMMRGPFFGLESKDGLIEDDFYTCAEQDLLDAAQNSALRILIIGKPRSGKTLQSKNLAAKLDLVHINVENWINALLTKIKNYELPEDLEEGQEPPRFLDDLEESVNQLLLSGIGPSDEQMVEIIRRQIKSPQAVLTGYILDLSYYPRESSWASTIRYNRLLGETPDGRAVEFSHIIDLWVDDEDVRLRANHIKANPDDGNIYSRWEREERKKPKVYAEDEEVPDEENDPNKPFDELTLVQRSCDTEERIREELQYYNNTERPAFEELMINFFDNQFIKIDCAGLTPDELTDCITCRIKPDDDLPLRPLAIQIEGGGDYKSLLSEGLEENQIPRKWSLWKQADPVSLFDGKVVMGLPEYAAHYNGNVFVFSTEENLKEFLNQPKKYLQYRPSMPNIFRVLMLGARGVGKHTQAQMLSDQYGWKVVDYKEVVKSKLEQLIRQDVHIPNNPVGGQIGLSEQELTEIIEGKPFPAWKFIPWIFDYLGYQLEKRKPPPPEEKPEEEQEEELDDDARKKRDAELKKKMIEEEKKRKEEEEIQRQKEERRRKRQEFMDQGLDPVEHGVEDSEEEPIIIEDLSIDQLVLGTDERTGQPYQVGGFILIGFPETEEQINRLKAHGLDFDKIVYLNDTNEEEPGAEIKKRMSDVELFDWDWENENALRILNLAKEQLNEEIIKEISCNGTVDEVFIRIRNEIDPFYLKVDNPDDVRVSADLSEEDKKLPKGDFGDYCPVTYVKDNWIVRGNQEFEVTVHGKTYWLAGEKEAEEFKFNPSKFLVTMNGEATQPLQAPPPKILVMGHRGAGVTTQIRMLCDKFKLDEFNLKEQYLAKLKEEKEKRKRRRLLDRGFRPPQPPEEEGMEPPPDPEIEDDPEDFDREGHEREVMKMIYNSSKGYVIDGTWRDLPEGLIGQSLQDLMFESRRVPEIVIIIKCKEQNTFQRLINFDAIKDEYNRLMEQRAAERKRVRDEDREKFLEELKSQAQSPDNEEGKTPEEIEEDIAKWEEDRDAEDEAADENDPERPNYEEMVEKERETLREMRTNDDAFFEEFSTVLKDKQVFVIDDIKGDLSAEFVNIKILDRIKDNLQFRKDLIERQLAQPLKPEEVPFFEKSYIYKHSKYGVNSPLQLENPNKNKKNAVLYRERMYFMTDKDQQEQFLKEPSKYVQSISTIPLDIQIKPKMFIIGLPKSGKTSLCRKLVERTGIVHLKMSKVIQEFMDKDSVQSEQLRQLMKMNGNQIDDDLLVSLLLKRIQLKDCQVKGFILEDFPKTRNQALYLAKRGLVPTNVIHMRQSIDQPFAKTEETKDVKFGHNRMIMMERVKFYEKNTPNMLSFYQRLYNNVVEIDSQKSKWYIEDIALKEISKNLKARQDFARDYFLKEREGKPCKVKDLKIDRCLVKQSISPEFEYYCPVTWRNEKLLVKCNDNVEDCVLHKNVFYFFKGQKERDMFIDNPERFLVNVNIPKKLDFPIRLPLHNAAQIMQSDKHLNSHCPVTLMDEERVNKGDSLLLIIFRELKFIFQSEFKLQRFLNNPFKYSQATLPVKMPPPEDKVSLYNLQRMEDSIAFMEQSLGQVVTKALREVSDNRLKYPNICIKETMLKLFALFLKTENPANTENMKRKYANKMKQFIQRCELPEEIFDLANEKEKKKPRDQWPEFKENYYNDKGAEYDQIISIIEQEKVENFINYIR